MLKELVIAIILGGLLGFGVTGGLITLNRRQNPIPIQNSVPSPTGVVPMLSRDNTPAPVITPTPVINQTNIKISSPINGAVVNQNSIDILGIAPANSLVVAALNTQSVTTTAKSDGSFSLKISLEAGYNLISITAVDKNDNLSEIQINLTYSTATF